MKALALFFCLFAAALVSNAEDRALSEGEARTFLDVAKESGDRFEALYVLAVTSGLRRGEILGLRWDDADLEKGTLRVGRSLVREGGLYTLGESKSKRGRRQVNLTPRTVNALKAHRKRQLEDRVRLTGLYKDQGLIFATAAGTPIQPENLVKRSFKPLLKRAGLPEIRFHDLRAHLRHAAAGAQHSSKDRPRAPRTRYDSHDPRHLQSLPVLDGRSGLWGDGGCLRIAVTYRVTVG